MHVLHGFDHVPARLRGSAVAIGNFDGVHRGHQALLREALEHGRKLGTLAGAMIFEPHPREHFQPKEPHFRLTTLVQKLTLFERLGLDLAVVIAFDARLATLTPQDFIERVLVAGLGVRHVVVGYDFFFGKGRAGTPDMLCQAGAGLGFGVSVLEPVAEAGAPLSSTAVRLALAQGDVKGAAHMLGHWWRVAGTVVGGAKRGTGLGYPTANIVLPRGTALGHGIYAVRVYLRDKVLSGAAYLGTRPTFDNGPPVLEVFLFDFDGALYGREIEVELIDFVRGDCKFESVDALRAQMDKDCRRARDVLASLVQRPAGDRLPLEP
jgi:riboflavin kinase/FMN adenylyltransferase